jgi:hypothetical protein
LLKDVKNWIKEVGANLSSLLKFERMYYWRKGKFNIAAQTMNYLIENEDKLNVDKFQSCLNSIVEKHQLVYTNGEERQFVVGDLVKYKYLWVYLVALRGRSLAAMDCWQKLRQLRRGLSCLWKIC